MSTTWQEMREKFSQSIPNDPGKTHEVFGISESRGDELMDVLKGALRENENWTDIIRQIVGQANDLNEFAYLIWAAARTYSLQHDSDNPLVGLLMQALTGGGKQ